MKKQANKKSNYAKASSDKESNLISLSDLAIQMKSKESLSIVQSDFSETSSDKDEFSPYKEIKESPTKTKRKTKKKENE